MERLDARWIESSLAGMWPGWRIQVEDVVGSTNDVARQEAERGAPEGLVVLAEEQTAGRGRARRRWVSGSGESLLASVLLRPPMPASSAFLLTALAATSAAAAVEELSGLRCDLKWPNDLLVQGRKVAGFLTEMCAVQDAIEWAVVGLGINVSTSFADCPELAATATSLEAETGQALSRNALAVALLRQMSQRYRRLTEGDREASFLEWRQRLSTLGRQVTVGFQSEGKLEQPAEGTAEDVEPDGALLLRLSDGSLRRVLSGDVSLR